MEQKEIDIYEILKEMPMGTKLYSPILGVVTLVKLMDRKDDYAIGVDGKKNGGTFYKDGRYFETGEIMLFPSKEMRDWTKFFKKGDVVECVENGNRAFGVFDGWSLDNGEISYIDFFVKYAWSESTGWLGKLTCPTHFWSKADQQAAKDFIESIEKEEGGKLNLETLEIEKPGKAEMAKEKPTHKFKPFDKVLVRFTEDGEWTPAIYERDNDKGLFPYRVFSLQHSCTCNYKYCIPFEKHEHLAFTNEEEDTLPF